MHGNDKKSSRGISPKKRGDKLAKYEQWVDPDSLLKLEAWARDGLTDEDLARKMGIAPSTLYVWKKKYLEFDQALKRGKEVVDIQVENALLKKALGYTLTEVKKEQSGDKYKVVETIKEVSPDTSAQMFWLKNRKPDKWRGNPEVQQENESLKKAMELLGGMEDGLD